MLDINFCRQRQSRLLKCMERRKLDAVVCGLPQHVYYLTGHWTFWLHQSAVVVFGDGRSWLLTANQPARDVAADDVAAYEANWMGTQRQEQPAVAGEMVRSALASRKARRIGFDASMVCSQIPAGFGGECEAIDEDLWQLRRKKDPDELALMKMAIRCSEAMYARAKQILRPGITEIDVFNEMHAAAVRTAGEPLTALLGNDYACAVPGGPPRKCATAQRASCISWILGRPIGATSPTTRGRLP